MADFFLEGPDFGLQPLEPEIRLVLFRDRESSISQDSSRGEALDDSLLCTTAPDPIKLKGVGGTTL